MQSALEAVTARLYEELDGARFERRDDLIVAVYPPFPIPQFNGPWVVADSQLALDALAGAISEVETAGAWPWVQTRSGHDRVRQAARELGMTHTELLPGMVIRPGELIEVPATVEVDLIASEEEDAANEILARCLGAPKELLVHFNRELTRIRGVCWYVGRLEGEIVSTALGFTSDHVTGVFNVATPPEFRGRGYGAALTSRVVSDGFGAGSNLAFLQSSNIGHGLYRTLGFRSVEEYQLLTRPAPAQAQAS
jgi:N-acetylglutamate synthase